MLVSDKIHKCLKLGQLINYLEIHSSEFYDILDIKYDCVSWAGTGNLIFAKALVDVIGNDKVEIKVIASDKYPIEHIVVKVIDEDIYIDADGVKSGWDMLNYWKEIEHAPNPRFDNPPDKFGSEYIDDIETQNLLKEYMLKHKFNEYI